MVDTLKYILNKYKIDSRPNLPIILPGKREDLASLFNELEYKTGAEIGVASGHYSEVLCKSIPRLELHCIDSWETYSGGEYEDQEALNRHYHEAQKHLAEYSCNFIKKLSSDAVQDFKDSSLDFVYIDANHDLDFVLDDISRWSKIIRPGGVISGHDYVADNTSHTKTYGVVEAVNSYIHSHRINPWFVFGDERSASWFWVKT